MSCWQSGGDVRGDVSKVFTEVLYGARWEDERVVEGGVSETYWCCGHDVLVRAAAVVTVAVVVRRETANIIHSMSLCCVSIRSKSTKRSPISYNCLPQNVLQTTVENDIISCDKTSRDLLTAQHLWCYVHCIVLYVTDTASRINYHFAIGLSGVCDRDVRYFLRHINTLTYLLTYLILAYVCLPVCMYYQGLKNTLQHDAMFNCDPKLTLSHDTTGRCQWPINLSISS